MRKYKIIYLIAFCVVWSVAYSTKSNLFITQEDSVNNYHEIVNNFNNWRSFGYELPVGFRIDSSDYRHPKHFFQIIMWEYRGKFQMHLGLISKLLLPYQQEVPENAKITLTYKSENLKSIKLVTSLFDERENKIRSDTLFMPDINIWNTCYEGISLKGSRFLMLELMAEGIDSTYLINDKATSDSIAYRTAHIDSTCNQNLWIDNIHIELDGIDICRYTEREILEPCRINPEKIIPIEDENSFSNIPEMKEKKIIALGETIHGSEAFNELFYQIVKYQVQHNQCKLIMLELDMSLTLPLNSYIQGNENFNVDSVLYDIRYATFSYQQLKNVLLFLKTYNQSAEKKVHLIGIDTRIDDVIVFPGLYISEYLYMLNKNHNHKQIDTVCYELRVYNKINGKDIYASKGEEIKKIEKDFLSKKMMTDTELKIFSYCYQNHIRVFEDMAYKDLTTQPKLKKQLQINREIWMFDNAKFFIDLICGQDEDSKVLIYGHSGHLGLKEDGTIPYTFGQYMRDFYRDKYYCTGLITNEGSFRTVLDRVFTVMQLKQDPKSIESELSNFAGNCLYVPVQSVSVPHTRIRNIGLNYENNQFKTVTPAIYFDAIIYKKETEAAKSWPGVLGTYNDIRINDERSMRQYQRLSKKLEPYSIY